MSNILSMDVEVLDLIIGLNKKDQKQVLKLLHSQIEKTPPPAEVSDFNLAFFSGLKKQIKIRRKADSLKTDSKKTLKERQIEFRNSVKKYSDFYSVDLLKTFYEYWIERGENDKKMRFEKEKTFGIRQRLATFKRNEERFNKPKYGSDQEIKITTNIHPNLKK